MVDGTGKGIRLQVYLARCGIDSRRGCETLISQGRVAVNGKTITAAGSKVYPGDKIEFDGKEVRQETQHYYILLNKPPGYLCANKDRFSRPLALDLVQKHYDVRLFHVGRLDLQSSGAIFFTNDGEFAKRIMHPSSGFEKEYIVEANQRISHSLLESFKKGITIDSVLYRVKEYYQINPTTVHLVLIEGKYREIRIMFQAYGLVVCKLHRIRIGPVSLGKLKSGAFRDISAEGLESFRNPKGGY